MIPSSSPKPLYLLLVYHSGVCVCVCVYFEDKKGEEREVGTALGKHGVGRLPESLLPLNRDLLLLLRTGLDLLFPLFPLMV